MKAAMKVIAMSKGALATALVTPDVSKKTATELLNTLADVGTAEVKKTGTFTIPGLCRLKTRKKPATKAGKKEMFGKMVTVKAKPATTVVKAFPVAAFKAMIEG
eukprot:CAMPEP_0171089412 /NCGR_PEP_ID=MMETSP0766_2-20121228/25084_1 /TAXON_ID=439317 /ORGANISM="Gambierdiscus australes, Strain CAWD 149" /LENGTH=103 /DNA_ID=CAMNT_0011547283 /DNA_START=85 /DNA_END=393 /DNA_ORIENTATION=+